MTAPALAADPHGLGTLLLRRLRDQQAIGAGHPSALATTLTGVGIACTGTNARETKRLGYRGHAFACAEGILVGEVLGAILNPKGRIMCTIQGVFIGNGCYDLTVCGRPDTICFS